MTIIIRRGIKVDDDKLLIAVTEKRTKEEIVIINLDTWENALFDSLVEEGVAFLQLVRSSH